METASRSPLHLQQLLYQLRHQLRHLQKPSPTKKPEDPDSPQKYLDGKYTASAKGFNGDVKVIVTIKDGVIKALKQENTDTKQFFEKAWSVLEEQIIGTDSVDDIDAVSGATYSSTGFWML